MKSIIITLIVCATAIACAVLLRVQRTPSEPRYQLYGIEETMPANGKNVRSVYRLDMISGKTWRISSNPFPIGGDPQHPTVNWADGWEEMPESPEAAVTKAEAEWKRATQH